VRGKKREERKTAKVKARDQIFVNSDEEHREGESEDDPDDKQFAKVVEHFEENGNRNAHR